MGEYIYNETLSGTVDGVNKTFTSLYTIEKIEEVYIGGASYRDLTFDGNTVTLTDAPPIGAVVTIDYFKLVIPSVTPVGDVTFGEVIDDIYEKIYGKTRAEGVSTSVYILSQVKKKINNGLVRMKNLRRYKEDIYSYSFNKASDGKALSYNASYVDVGTISNIPSSGMFILKDSVVVNYSTYTSGHLNGTPGITYEKGDYISIGYKIPTGVKRVSEILFNGQPLEYIDSREFSINSKYYTIIKTASGDEYIFLPYSTNTNDIITVKYIPTSSYLTSDSDIVNIDREYFEVLSYYALYQLYQDREDDRWQTMEKNYRELLTDYKSYKSRAVDGINNKFKSNILKNF